MADNPLLLDLVARWKAAVEAGQAITPESLCQCCPEMLEPLRSAIVNLHGYDANTVSQPSADAYETQPCMPAESSTRRVQPYWAGQVVDGFTLLRQIGQGGFGQVFETEDALLNRRVAIKFLHVQALERPGAREQFLNEARAMAAITHDHVVSIYQVGKDGENLFLVMPLLAGETLADKLQREGILPLSEFTRIARELANGLSAIHAKGLIHRDLKPANIWLEAGTGRVKILDLGLADDVANLRKGGSAGTPAYMSPEQINGEPLDFRTDLFSLGAIFYECLTARRAFTGKSLTEIIEAVRRAMPLPLGEANPATPVPIRELVTALLRKDVEQRPVSALSILQMLPASADASAAPSPPPKRRWLWPGAILLLMVSLVGYFASPRQPEPSTPAVPTSHPPAFNRPLTIDAFEVTPLQAMADNRWRELPPLTQGLRPSMTMENAIDVKAKLSKPGYCYILLYRADGENVLLFPRRDDRIPALTDEPSYPPRDEDVAYQLNDSSGVWLVAVVASETPLPCYREWKASHQDNPWSKHDNPNQLTSIVIDDGESWSSPTQGGSFSQTSRGEVNVAGRVRIKPLVDWWKEKSGGTVKAMAFPVVER